MLVFILRCMLYKIICLLLISLLWFLMHNIEDCTDGNTCLTEYLSWFEVAPAHSAEFNESYYQSLASLT